MVFKPYPFMSEKVTGVILAGGLGTRLRPLISDKPKVLAPVDGRPFLAYLLDQLERGGIRRVILCIGHLGHQVKQAFGNHYGQLELVYSEERELRGTAGALRLAYPLITSGSVLVMNGDSFCDVDLGDYVAWQQANDVRNSMVLTKVKDTRRFGRVIADHRGKILRFEEKQESALEEDRLPVAEASRPEDLSGWINAGIYLMARDLLCTIPANESISLEFEMFPSWIQRGLTAYRVNAPFIDIGTPESYALAQRFFLDHRSAVSSTSRVVFLDRDGTINVEKQYLGDPDELELLPNAAAAIRRLRYLGFKVVIITNQSGVSRGYFDRDTLDAIHHRLIALLTNEGTTVDGIYVCPHSPEDGCECRKPKPGLIHRAAQDFHIDTRDAFVVGDKDIDIEAGRRAGAKTLLVRTGYGEQALACDEAHADYVTANLMEAAQVIERALSRS